VVKNRIYLIVVSILFVSLVSTIVFASVNINNVMGTSGVEIFLPSISSNYSSINVNNSQYLQGYTPTTLGNWLQTTFGWLTSLGNNIAFTNESNTFTLNNTFNGNITVLGGINISKYIYTNLSSCDTIDTTSTGMLVCGIDNAGTGASRTFVKLAENVTTTNSTHFNQTVLTLSAAARTNYTFACDLWQTSAAAATGVQYNVSSPIAPTYFSVSFQNPTSTTAYLIGACSGAARECTSLATASVLTAPMPTTIKGRLVNGANTNNLVIALRSEIALSAVQVLKESYCYMEIEA
jgi:hypothetical protein